MTKTWMIRAGRGGRHIDDFLEHNVAMIGWGQLGELNDDSREALGKRVKETYPDYHASAAANFTGILEKFRKIIHVGDRIVTYNPERRIYHLGTVTGPYKYDPNISEDHPQTLPVKWDKETSRDDLKNSSRNSLGSTLTIFAIKPEIAADLENPQGPQQRAGPTPPTINQAAVNLSADEDEIESQYDAEQMSEQSIELIKDRILKLDDRQMEELLAGILKAMGYKSQVNPVGPDRGIDVTASPDGLGLEQPRIKAEVKHRQRTQMGAPDIRNFMSALRQGDSGIYLSTGGFTKEARYEADRSNVPVKLLALDDLVQLIIDNYANFDDESRLLIPLVRIWWPAS